MHTRNSQIMYSNGTKNYCLQQKLRVLARNRVPGTETGTQVRVLNRVPGYPFGTLVVRLVTIARPMRTDIQPQTPFQLQNYARDHP